MSKSLKKKSLTKSDEQNNRNKFEEKVLPTYVQNWSSLD